MVRILLPKNLLRGQALKPAQKIIIYKQHAHAAELLLPYLRARPDGGGARVLDVGAGSGYLTSVFYHLVRDTQQQPQEEGVGDGDGDGERTTRRTALVVGIEHIPTLAALAEKNIRADRLGKAIDEQGIILVTGDGRLGMLFPFFLFWSKASKHRNHPWFVFFFFCRVRGEGPV